MASTTIPPSLRAVLDALEEPVLVIDRSMRIVEANAALVKRVGGRVADAIGAPCCFVTHAREAPCWEAGEECPVRQVFETGEPARALHWHHDEHGKLQPDEVVASPIRDESGAVTLVVEELRDGSELLRSRAVADQMRQELDLLRGLVRVCAHCKRVLADGDQWEQMESYVARHSGAEFSHGICPSCYDDVMAELERARR